MESKFFFPVDTWILFNALCSTHEYVRKNICKLQTAFFPPAVHMLAVLKVCVARITHVNQILKVVRHQILCSHNVVLLNKWSLKS